AAATSLVRSVELLSTTITSSTNSGVARKTRSIPCSSLRQGMITVIDCPLYMFRLFTHGVHQYHLNTDIAKSGLMAEDHVDVRESAAPFSLSAPESGHLFKKRDEMQPPAEQR